MTNVCAIAAVLILGAGMCQTEKPATPDVGQAQVAPAPEKPYIDQKNEDLRQLEQGLQEVHDERGQQLDQKSKAGEP